MFIYLVFRGDGNSALQYVQFDAYGDAVSHMVHEAVTQYFNAEKFLNTKTTLGDKIREEEKESVVQKQVTKTLLSYSYHTLLMVRLVLSLLMENEGRKLKD